MPKKPVTLGEHFFASKQEAKTHYSKILNDYPLESSLEGVDFDYVMALLLNHPRAKDKIGSGVKSIKVSQGYNSNNRCFHVVRKDDSVEDFSIGKCIDGDHSEFHKFCIAARKAVEPQVIAYKRKYFEENASSGFIKCQFSGKPISIEEAHADHREPFTFSSIAHFFIDAKDIAINAVEYISEGQYGNIFKDEALANSFVDYHKKHAKLRIIDGKTNLGKGYLGRVTSTKADGGV